MSAVVRCKNCPGDVMHGRNGYQHFVPSAEDLGDARWCDNPEPMFDFQHVTP